jgi:hypothetical protein
MERVQDAFMHQALWTSTRASNGWCLVADFHIKLVAGSITRRRSWPGVFHATNRNE